MMHLVRNLESFDIRDTIQVSKGNKIPLAEFDLIANNQIIPLPKNLFIFISPLLRKIFRSILPCFRPQVVIPEISKATLDLFLEIVTGVSDRGFEKIIDLDELKSLDEVFGFFQIDTKYFKIEVADVDVAIDKEYVEIIDESDIKSEIKDEPTTFDDIKLIEEQNDIEEFDTEKECDPKNEIKSILNQKYRKKY